ncbi:MAG: N-acetyl-gamma-glutamyl-phosphate reductase [Clostridia bacterium]|nr:N-acetyl-gamma-glutamyl-phosphate reductase [Clostridia bacterium]
MNGAKTKIFIDGSEGTTGLRIHERFEGRADVELLSIDPALRKDKEARRERLNACDVAFLCLPDDAARESVSLIENPNVRVLDTSTAHRTADGWAYGFPELSQAHRNAIKAGKRIAVPGCHASGFIALVYPLMAAGLLSPNAALSCFSITGYSGGGKRMIADYQSEARHPALSAPRVYALPQQHKHLGEMRHVCGLSAAPVFSPIVADYYSGMLVSVPLHAGMLQKPMDTDALREVYRAHYASERFVRVTDAADGAMLSSNALSGLDFMEITVCGNAERMSVNACFDNLGKGASGAAIQCLNCMLGLDEATGLQLGE